MFSCFRGCYRAAGNVSGTASCRVAHRLDHPRDDRDAVRDGGRRSARRGRQLRPLSARSRPAAAGRGAARSERGANLVVAARSGDSVRHADGPAPAARSRACAVLPVRAPRPAGHHADHPLAGCSCRRRGSRQRARRAHRAAAGRYPVADGHQRAPEDAAGIRPRAGHAQKHRRERRRRFPARHGRHRWRRERPRGRETAIGDDEHRARACPRTRCDHRAALRPRRHHGAGGPAGVGRPAGGARREEPPDLHAAR